MNAHGLDARVDVGVVNDFARQEDAAIGKLAARLIRVVDGAIDAVTEAEFLRELEMKRPGGGLIANGLEALDDGALIGTRQNRSDLGFQAETLLEIHFAQRNSSITFFVARAQNSFMQRELRVAACARRRAGRPSPPWRA